MIGKRAIEELKQIVGEDATKEITKEIRKIPAKELKKFSTSTATTKCRPTSTTTTKR